MIDIFVVCVWYMCFRILIVIVAFIDLGSWNVQRNCCCFRQSLLCIDPKKVNLCYVGILIPAMYTQAEVICFLV